MAKRASEHQITRDDASDDEDQQVKVGMSKADASVLATRQYVTIHSLAIVIFSLRYLCSQNKRPSKTQGRHSSCNIREFIQLVIRRSESKDGVVCGIRGSRCFPCCCLFRDKTRAAPASAPAPVPTAKPAEVSGDIIGVQPSSLMMSAQTPRFAGFMGFGAAPKSAAPASTSSAETKPAFTGFGTAKSTTTATFAPTSSPFGSFSAPKPEPPKSDPEPKENTNVDTDAALKYWTSLRGLNHAFVENIKKSYEGDMFSDLTGPVKQYQEFREKIVKEYEDSKKSSGKKPAETKSTFSFGASTSASSPFTFGAPKAPAESKPTLPMPPKPTSFGSKDAPLVTPAATPPVIPPSPKKPAPMFNSTEAPVPEATPTPSPMPEGSTPNIFEVAAKKSVEEKKEEKDKPASPSKPAFTFGSSSSTGFGATSSPFGLATTAKPDAKPFSFSTSNTTPFSGFGGASTTTTASVDGASTTATPGASTPSKAFTFTNPLSTPGTPFAFGAGSPKGNTTTAKPAGSVGFSFGASPPRKEPTSFPFGAVSGPTSAAATPKSEAGHATSDDDKDKPKEGESTENKTDEEPDTDKAQTNGAGEENEDTVFGARARVLRFYNQAWVGVGIGQFKIKYDRETKKRRVLHRLEGTGRVVLVSGPRFKGLMRFTALDDQGHPMLYRVKVKTEAEAESLTDSLKDAIEAAKGDKA
ncbi:ranBP1 domain-containing protein [Rhizoctonia solani AG-1 IA]|uniref:RanBP1 domain-containing protein n=1 Tax=Thanatephorus cucumeris (strain AG1-IA) TaxID=983506 RepID=L8WU43_THACA|nr:ranBP1 domain-containing protein [Rhizoctonia solani AG-1 IA]